MPLTDAAIDIDREADASQRGDYFDRVHQRSFSLNVFLMNAVELIDAMHRVKDPGEGMNLMMEKNRDAGRQTHRELNRHVHNFVSSALTLVEHTRVFMRTYYAGTALITAYENKVVQIFAQSPVAQFVQGLRNYMLHKGLPNSNMFVKFESNPDAQDGGGTIESGVIFDIRSLLEWEGWKPVARRYLENSGQHLDLLLFAQEYFALVKEFHGWLDESLAEHHAIDLKAKSYPQAYENSSSEPGERLDRESPVELGVFEFEADISAEIAHRSTDILDNIQKLDFLEVPAQFETKRPTAQINAEDVVDSFAFSGATTAGGMAVSFIQREGDLYGLDEKGTRLLDLLVDYVKRVDWVRSGVSRKFITSVFYDWARNNFSQGGQSSFAQNLIDEARENMTSIEVWTPIDHMEVEQGFDFGPVRIEPITSATMTYFQEVAPIPRPEQADDVNRLFENLRGDIQGYAAVVVTIEAEPEAAMERALTIAQDAVGLLNLFSPAATKSYVFNPVSLIGAACIPSAKQIALYEDGFSLTERTLPKHIGRWRMSQQRASELNPELLQAAASLVIPDALDEFSLAVRSSILAFTKGTSMTAPWDRLHDCLRALEGVLLRHDAEPRAHTVARRMSTLLSLGGTDAEEVRRIVYKIYWLHGRSLPTQDVRSETEMVALFTIYAYHALCFVLGSTSSFRSKLEFLIELDDEANKLAP